MKENPLIAIVDDDASICTAVKRLLRSWHMTVMSYSSARDFLDNGEHHNPDCIVLDIQMPDMTGIELFDELNNRPHRSSIVFITAHDEKAVRNKVQETGCAYLHKPFNDQEFLAAIDGALAKSGGAGDSIAENILRMIVTAKGEGESRDQNGM